MLKKGYLQISFGWIFAIVVGIVILFLAIFLASKLINIGETKVDSSTAKEIEVLLNPLETSFGEEKTTSFIMPSEARINNKCDNFGNFGTQGISVSQKTFGKYSNTNIDISFENKYIFSDEFIEGKKFYLNSKPLNLPFKIADMIFITSKKYCFLDFPEEIEKDIPLQENIIIEEGKCSEEDVKVCFSDEDGCDIYVNYAQGYVEKNKEKVYFSENLLYGAIFSKPDIYECQTKRIMQRASQLYILNYNKAYLIQEKCQSNLNEELLSFSNDLKNYEKSEDLENIVITSNIINEKNKNEECKLF
jgi:hypothetical protein